MNLVIKWLPDAESDVDSQAIYYLEVGSLALFDRFRSAVFESARLLAMQPELGERLPGNSQYATEIRRWQVAGFREHLIFYRHTSSSLEIVRVLHAKRDITDVAF